MPMPNADTPTPAVPTVATQREYHSEKIASPYGSPLCYCRQIGITWRGLLGFGYPVHIVINDQTDVYRGLFGYTSRCQ